METASDMNLDLPDVRKFIWAKKKYDTECLPTATSNAQAAVEESVGTLFDAYLRVLVVDPLSPELQRSSHIEFLNTHLLHLPEAYESLDCGRAWLCYWIIHSLNLLNHPIESDIQTRVINFLERCQSDKGGFGGGPGQLPHLAPTYAAVNALSTIGTEQALKIINREGLRNFLWSVRVGDGSFFMHVGGEVDIRSVYCALIVAQLTNIYSDNLFENSAEWIARCQTYEGGFSSIPGMEAHGGYSFCGIASLYLLKSTHLCEMKSLLRWTTNKQMRYEGGFQGRTNKLVDGCYSFWQGATMALVYMVLGDHSGGDSLSACDNWLFDNHALQEYILICCQDSKGGLTDKPKVPRDSYHTCYTLSGLSLSQHLPSGNIDVVGTEDNLLAPINPIFNICVDSLTKTKTYFSQFDRSVESEASPQ